MTALLLGICMLVVPPGESATPIRDSVERVVASVVADHHVGRVEGFEQESVQQPKKEKFFGATNLLMGAGIFGSAVADLETTLICINTTGKTVTQLPDGGTSTETRWCEESNAFMRPFVAKGRWPAYGGKAIVYVPVWVGTHYMRRSEHRSMRVAGWILPLVAVGTQAIAAHHNVRETRWVRTGHR